MILQRYLLFLAVFVGALAASETSTRAETSATGSATAPFDGVPIFADTTLVEMRAGFALAPGLEIEFGVLARTIVDGRTVLETALSSRDDGVLAITPAMFSSIGRVLPGFTMIAEDQSEKRASGAPLFDINISALIDGPGAFFNDGNANAAGFVQVSPGQVLNLLASNGMGTRIDQQLNLIFFLKGFAGFQQNARAAGVVNNFFSFMAPP